MTEVVSGTTRIERELAVLNTDVDPPAGWEARVLAAIGGERIERELMQLGADVDPPAGWEARVLVTIGERSTRESPPRRAVHIRTAERPKRRWWHLAIPAFAIAAVALLVLLLRPQPLALDVEIAQAGGVTLASAIATSTTVGSVAHVRATDGGPHRAVWIYRDDRALVVACPGEARCRETGTGLAVDVTLDAIAVYRLVALTSKSPIPQPRGSYDDDLAAALRAGSERTIRLIAVR